MRFDRRRALELFGLAGAGYCASTLSRPARVRAAGAAIPRRLVFFFTEQGTLKQFNPDGTLKPFWAPTVAGAPDPLKIQAPWTTSTFTLGDMHQPLVPLQKQLLFLDGVDMLSANVDPTQPANAHINGETHAMIGASRQSQSLAGGISIDQFIARGINSPSPLTALPSLEVFIDAWGGAGGGEEAPLYAAPGQPIPIDGNPATIYKRLFPNGAQSLSTLDQTKLAAQIAQQKSVLDYAANDFSNLAGKLGKLDSARLSAHAAAIRDLENRLALGVNATCTAPAATIANGYGRDGSGATFTTNADILMRLVQTSLACDLARVATLYVTASPAELYGYTANILGTVDFHDLVHKTNGAPASGKTTPPLGDNPQAIAVVKAYHSSNAALFAKFLGLLQAIPEGDGTTLLDNTLVVWCGQISGGDHSLDHIPYVLAGSLGGAVKTGRYVRLPRKPSKAYGVGSDGPAHNNLFVSLANLMGLPITTFGNPSVCTGPLVGALS